MVVAVGQAIGFGISVALRPSAGSHVYHTAVPSPFKGTHSPGQIDVSAATVTKGNFLIKTLSTWSITIHN